MTTTVNVQLPNSIQQQLEAYAERDGVSVDQFISTAVAEKLATLATLEDLQERANRGRPDAFDAVLQKVPAVAPPDDDRLPG